MNIRKIAETVEREDRVFGSSAFTNIIFARNTEHSRKCVEPAGGDIVIRVSAPSVSPEQTLCIIGECERLGCWQPSRAAEMDDAEFPLWTIRIPAAALPQRFEYKFIVAERQSKRLIAWEEGYNRIFEYNHPDGDEVLEVLAAPFVNPVRWHGAGVAIPLFSLRSENDFGIGEFRDIELLADWAAATGQCVIQLLPVNDTTDSGTWRDSYPYNANSAFALHPQYISLRDAGVLNDPAEQERFDRAGGELNALPAVDYEKVNRLKNEYLHKLYEQCGTETMQSDEYLDFFGRNASWLLPYCVYSVLRDKFRTSDFSKWGEFAHYDAAEAEMFTAEHPHEVGYYGFVQFHLHRQLRSARDYAHSRGVILKGDIPIGISRTSVDAWTNPEMLHLHSSAGAPPDDFSVKGQNWGFPTYDWQNMAANGYAWWRRRFVKMSDSFDAYRIDHILGFFRIWEIPLEATSALLGHFSPALPYSEEEIAAYGFHLDRASHTAPVSDSDNVLFVEDPYCPQLLHPRIAARSTEIYTRLSDAQKAHYDRLYEDFFFRHHNDFWRIEALRKLVPLISATRMLVCGEDLGMIPACVPEVMRELQILSLEIERMPKKYGIEFDDPAQYPYLSVCSPSTHDMSNIRLWWSEDAARSERYCDAIGCGDEAMPTECTPQICEAVIRRQLQAASILTIIPLQDWLAVDGELRSGNPSAERINDPSNPDQYWQYRMHLTLEDLSAADGFNTRLRDMIRASGREHCNTTSAKL